MSTESNEVLYCDECYRRQRRADWPRHPVFGVRHCGACYVGGFGMLVIDPDQGDPAASDAADVLDLARCSLELVAVVRDAGTRPRAGGDRARLAELMAEVDWRALATAKRLQAAAAEGGGS